MFAVYILLSLKDKRTYVGYSKNFKERFRQHESGRVKATRGRRPLKVIYTEEFITEQEAKKRELWWKTGAGRRKLRALFEKGFKGEVLPAGGEDSVCSGQAPSRSEEDSRYPLSQIKNPLGTYFSLSDAWRIRRDGTFTHEAKDR